MSAMAWELILFASGDVSGHYQVEVQITTLTTITSYSTTSTSIVQSQTIVIVTVVMVTVLAAIGVVTRVLGKTFFRRAPSLPSAPSPITGEGLSQGKAFYGGLGADIREMGVPSPEEARFAGEMRAVADAVPSPEEDLLRAIEQRSRQAPRSLQEEIGMRQRDDFLGGGRDPFRREAEPWYPASSRPEGSREVTGPGEAPGGSSLRGPESRRFSEGGRGSTIDEYRGAPRPEGEGDSGRGGPDGWRERSQKAGASGGGSGSSSLSGSREVSETGGGSSSGTSSSGSSSGGSRDATAVGGGGSGGRSQDVEPPGGGASTHR
ncbi:hypothetical protein MUP05_09360, partial [Candidatus Bathyarchaeota archaeon]|nr:hypothetical protein [Candidatus Bathyarchaeota archaeon]